MNTYTRYKETNLFEEIQNSDYDERGYDELRCELDSACEAETDETTLKALRLAVKHLCRIYPQYGRANYTVTATPHGNAVGEVVHVVDATHEEQARFYFHTRYSHKQYRVTSVVKH